MQIAQIPIVLKSICAMLTPPMVCWWKWYCQTLIKFLVFLVETAIIPMKVRWLQYRDEWSSFIVPCGPKIQELTSWMWACSWNKGCVCLDSTIDRVNWSLPLCGLVPLTTQERHFLDQSFSTMSCRSCTLPWTSMFSAQVIPLTVLVTTISKPNHVAISWITMTNWDHTQKSSSIWIGTRSTKESMEAHNITR